MTEDHVPWRQAIVSPEQVDGYVTYDLLATMFAQQALHMEAYEDIARRNGFDPVGKRDYGKLQARSVQAALREYAGYTVEELYEAINHLKNKPWKQTTRPVDREAFLEEVADAWHFFIEFHILAGITPKDLFRAYFKKAFKNIERQQTGY